MLSRTRLFLILGKKGYLKDRPTQKRISRTKINLVLESGELSQEITINNGLQ